MIARAAIAIAIAATAGACAVRDTVATSGSGGGDRDTYCMGTGPPVLIDDTCTGDVAENLFRQAVCTCSDIMLATDLTTDGFDSRVAPWTPGGAGGDVGANRSAGLGGTTTIGGHLAVAGSGGVQAGPQLHVHGDLDDAGALGRTSSAIRVDGAARIGGDVAVTSLDVAGALTTAPTATVTGTITAGSRTTAAVSVPPPCRCDAADVLDVAQVIADHRLANHDAAIGLAPDRLAHAGGDTALDLPCGRFYLDAISVSAGSLTLRATGRTALFVAGDVAIAGDFTVTVAPGAELDLFIAGVLTVPGALRLGDPARPRDLRVYIAGTGQLQVSGGSLYGGNLYAPSADLVSSAPLEVFGAVLVDHLTASAAVTVHYDRAIEVAGERCEP